MHHNRLQGRELGLNETSDPLDNVLLLLGRLGVRLRSSLRRRKHSKIIGLGLHLAPVVPGQIIAGLHVLHPDHGHVGIGLHGGCEDGLVFIIDLVLVETGIDVAHVVHAIEVVGGLIVHG